MIIIEKDLYLGGHNHTQIGAIERLANGRQLTIITSIAGHLATDGDRVKLVPLLSADRERKAAPALALENDTAKILSFFQSLKSDAPIQAIAPSADSYDFKLMLNVISAKPGLARFHARVLDERFISELSESELTSLRRQASKGNILLLTETGSLTDRLWSRFGLPSKAEFLLPCVILPDTPLSGSAGEHTGRPYRIGFLGGRRREKGYKQIPSILKQLLRYGRSINMDIEFVMQGNRNSNLLKNSLYNFKLIYNTLSPARKDGARIKLTKIQGFLSDKAFLDALLSLDVLIVPYSLQSYRYKGSGIIADGVLSLTPIIYTDGIAMSNYLKYGNGEPASSPKEFAEKILKILSNLNEYRARAHMARDAILADLQKTAGYLASLP